MKFRLGTRKSLLAMWQAEYIAERLKEGGADVEIVPFVTKGDKILDRSLSKIGSKGVFTEELEQALRDGEIDLAVHSSKDLQSSLPEDLSVISFSEREQVNDVLVSDKSCQLGDDIVIGTSSTRRVALLKHFYPNLKIVDMRGNLQTRIQKMRDGVCDALLLAYAGVHRMGYHDLIAQELDVERFTPPVGQGSVAIEVCEEKLGKERVDYIRKQCNHEATERCLLTERAFLKTLNGGCSIPVFGYAKNLVDGTIQFDAGIVSLNGKELIKETKTFTKEESIQGAVTVAEKLLNSRAGEILSDIKTELQK